MPSFHHSVAVLPLPFRCSVDTTALCRSAVPLYRCMPLSVRTELVETSFRWRRWRRLNNDQKADWLSSYGRRAKIGLGFDPICYGTAVTAQRQLQRQRRSGIFHVCNVRRLRNSYGIFVMSTATAKRQRNGGNQALDSWNCNILSIAHYVLFVVLQLYSVQQHYHIKNFTKTYDEQNALSRRLGASCTNKT